MSRHDERPLLEAVRDAGRMGRLCALATIVDTRGSTPRKIGTKMLVDPVAGLVARMVHVDLTRDLMSWSPAVCGGIMRVLVEPVEPAIAGRPKEPAGEGAVADVDRPKEARASGDGPAPTS
jgi:xanthine/CO dehydrogenase XdhC/CoxF family maturation factor